MSTDTHPLLEEISNAEPYEYGQSVTYIGIIIGLAAACYAAGWIQASKEYTNFIERGGPIQVPPLVVDLMWIAMGLIIIGIAVEVFFRYISSDP